MNPGTLLKHLSGTHYYYIGPVPGSSLVVVKAKGDHSGKAYAIEEREIGQFYEVVPEGFKKHQTYKNGITGGYFTVQDIYVNPDTDEYVVFGWYRRVYTNQALPHVIASNRLEHWTPVEP